MSTVPGTGFSAFELDAKLPQLGLAASVQAGRAWSNNGGLVAVLAAAADPETQWLALIVPERYMGGAQRINIVDQVEQLARSPGIKLELDGVMVVSY